jgi:chemotaxis-related protein WspB
VLYSLFSIGDDRYAIAINEVAVIAPFVKLKSMPSLPEYAAGLMNYRGDLVPVIDLCQLLISRPCSRILSTRIIITTIKSVSGEGDVEIGFLVENATGTFSADDVEFIESGMKNPEMPFIGPIANDNEGMITKITPQDIFEKIDERLFFPESVSARVL